MTTTNKKWTDEAVATLKDSVGSESPVSAQTVSAVAEKLKVSVRSVAAKLRQLDYEVASLATPKVSKFSPEQSDALTKFVTENAGTFTYSEIAERFMSGKFSSKEIQGKLLALELTASVRPTPKVEAARTYTPAEEKSFVDLAQSGAYLEDIANKLGKTLASVRGKALSLLRGEQISKIPAQKTSHAKDVVDPVTKLGAAISKMTVKEIASILDKTERGVKTLLTRRAIKVADYDGVAKASKAEGKAAAATA